MIKIKKSIKNQIRKQNKAFQKEFNFSNQEIEQSKLGFLFAFDNPLEINREKVEYQHNMQFAIIDILFNDYVNYIENSCEWSNEEANNINEINEYFDEYLRELDFFRFKNKNITTINEAVKELKKICFFPPRIVIKDGQIINITFPDVIQF